MTVRSDMLEYRQSVNDDAEFTSVGYAHAL